MSIKLWIDDLRPAPDGWVWIKTTDQTISILSCATANEIEIISLDHDAGDYASQGGDYINILNWLEKRMIETRPFNFPKIHLHTANVVGRENMRRIIQHNRWTEVYSI